MILLALALSVLFAFPAHGMERPWSVPARVTVVSDEVSLADLVKGAPASWSAVALGKAPRPGGERTLNRAWILQRAREAGADQAVEVPDTVVLARAGRSIDRDEVVRAVEEALNRTGRNKDLIRVTAVGLPGPVPEGELTLQVLPPAGDLSSASTVWVEAVSQGRVVGRAWARVDAARNQGAVVLTRVARKGDILRAEDLEVRTDKPARAQMLTEPAQAVGMRLVRSLSAGSQVSSFDVEEVPGVEKGQSVQLVARVGSVVATTVGRALERARIGEGVRVENVGSGRVLQGTLRETGVVEIRSDFGR